MSDLIDDDIMPIYAVPNTPRKILERRGRNVNHAILCDVEMAYGHAVAQFRFFTTKRGRVEPTSNYVYFRVNEIDAVIDFLQQARKTIVEMSVSHILDPQPPADGEHEPEIQITEEAV